MVEIADAVWANTIREATMPAKEQSEELCKNTIIDTHVTINGVKGIKYTSKVDPSNYIFIPTSGPFSDGNFKNGYNMVWTKTLDEVGPNLAYNLKGTSVTYYSDKNWSMPVRGAKAN